MLLATQEFCREQLALKHRYALALHTDEPHPHVHVIIKAISEQGERLNIRKATLREWREEFARHLRASVSPPMRRRASSAERRARGSPMAFIAPLGAARRRTCATGSKQRPSHYAKQTEPVIQPNCGYAKHGETSNADGSPPATR